MNSNQDQSDKHLARMKREQELKSCPCCNNKARLDTQQGFWRARDGKRFERCAVYCEECNLEISECYADYPSEDHDQVIASVIAKWNTRSTPSPTEPRVKWTASEIKTIVQFHRGSPDCWQHMADDINDRRAPVKHWTPDDVKILARHFSLVAIDGPMFEQIAAWLNERSGQH